MPPFSPAVLVRDEQRQGGKRTTCAAEHAQQHTDCRRAIEGREEHLHEGGGPPGDTQDLIRAWNLVSPLGFEPRTKGLKVPCSTTELRARRNSTRRRRVQDEDELDVRSLPIASIPANMATGSGGTSAVGAPATAADDVAA